MHRFFKLALVCEGWSLIAQTGRWNPLCSAHYYPESSASSYSKSRWCNANEAVAVRGEGHRKDEDALAAAVIASQALQSFWLSSILLPLESVPFRDGVQAESVWPLCWLPSTNKQHLRWSSWMNECMNAKMRIRRAEFEDRRGGGWVVALARRKEEDPGASVWALGRV